MPKVPVSSDMRQSGVYVGNAAHINPGALDGISKAGKAMGQAVASIGDAFGEVAGRIGTANDAQNLGNAQLAWEEGDFAIKQELHANQGEDGSGYTQAPEKYQKLYSDVMQNYPVSDPKQRQQLDLRMRTNTSRAVRDNVVLYQTKAHGYELKKLEGVVSPVEQRLMGGLPDEEGGISGASYERREQAILDKIDGMDGYVVTSAQKEAMKREVRERFQMAWYKSLITPGSKRYDLKAAEEYRKALQSLNYDTDDAGAMRPSGPAGPSGDFVRSPIGRTFPLPGMTPKQVPLHGKTPGSRGWLGHREGGEHAGLDIPGKVGSPVVAVGAGRVVKFGQMRGYGNYVDVEYGDGSVHRSAHLQRIDPGLAINAEVKEGQPVGTLGYSGNAGPEFPHVHYEVFPNRGKYDRYGFGKSRQTARARIDPIKYFSQGEGGSAPATAGTLAPVATAYSPQRPDSPDHTMQGGYGSRFKAPDGNKLVNTLDAWSKGDAQYVTVAGPESWNGKTGTIPSIEWLPPGATKSIVSKNVPIVFHDTGGRFTEEKAGKRFDIPVARDLPRSALNNQPFSRQGVEIVLGEPGQQQGNTRVAEGPGQTRTDASRYPSKEQGRTDGSISPRQRPTGMLDTPGLGIETRPIQNPDGSQSTIRTITIEKDADGRKIYVVIPTIQDGKQLSNEEAIARHNKNPQHHHYGIFDSKENANTYAKQLSEQQGKRLEGGEGGQPSLEQWRQEPGVESDAQETPRATPEMKFLVDNFGEENARRIMGEASDNPNRKLNEVLPYPVIEAIAERFPEIAAGPFDGGNVTIGEAMSMLSGAGRMGAGDPSGMVGGPPAAVAPSGAPGKPVGPGGNVVPFHRTGGTSEFPVGRVLPGQEVKVKTRDGHEWRWSSDHINAVSPERRKAFDKEIQRLTEIARKDAETTAVTDWMPEAESAMERTGKAPKGYDGPDGQLEQMRQTFSKSEADFKAIKMHEKRMKIAKQVHEAWRGANEMPIEMLRRQISELAPGDDDPDAVIKEKAQDRLKTRFKDLETLLDPTKKQYDPVEVFDPTGTTKKDLRIDKVGLVKDVRDNVFKTGKGEPTNTPEFSQLVDARIKTQLQKGVFPSDVRPLSKREVGQFESAVMATGLDVESGLLKANEAVKKKYGDRHSGLIMKQIMDDMAANNHKYREGPAILQGLANNRQIEPLTLSDIDDRDEQLRLLREQEKMMGPKRDEMAPPSWADTYREHYAPIEREAKEQGWEPTPREPGNMLFPRGKPPKGPAGKISDEDVLNLQREPNKYGPILRDRGVPEEQIRKYFFQR